MRARRAGLRTDRWTQQLALSEHPARRREPKRLRLRLLAVAGGLVTSGRRTVLHLPDHHHWASLLLDAVARLHPLAPPG